MKNKKQQKNRLFKAGIITVFVALLSLTLVSGTYASYTSEATVEDEASIAKWSWTVDSEELTTETENIAYELFQGTVYEIKDNKVDIDGGADGEVADGLLAPGTGGVIQLTVTNASDVDAQLSAVIESTTGTAPLQFSTTNDGSDWGAAADIEFTDLPVDRGADQTIKIYWMWEFGAEGDGADNTHTDVNGTKAYSLELKVTMEQVD